MCVCVRERGLDVLANCGTHCKGNSFDGTDGKTAVACIAGSAEDLMAIHGGWVGRTMGTLFARTRQLFGGTLLAKTLFLNENSGCV